MLTEKKMWVKDMKVAEKKKFRIAVRMIEEENLMEDCDDVELGGDSEYDDKVIVQIQDGRAIVDVIGKLSVGPI